AVHGAEVLGGFGVQRVEHLGSRGLVDRTPPHVVLGRLLLDDELVLGRAARELARVHGERAVGHERALVVLLLVVRELLVRQVVEHLAAVLNAKLTQAQGGGRGLMLRHFVSRLSCLVLG
ncbi:hypothetical protein L916_05840, partial [Phytophthora nicotianae]